MAKQPALSAVEIQIREQYRIAGNIRTADIEQPHNIVQRGGDEAIRLRFIQQPADGSKFLLAAFTDQIGIQQISRFGRQRRALLPDLTDRIDIRSHACLAAAQFSHQRLRKRGGDGATVKSQNLPLFYVFQ